MGARNLEVDYPLATTGTTKSIWTRGGIGEEEEKKRRKKEKRWRKRRKNICLILVSYLIDEKLLIIINHSFNLRNTLSIAKYNICSQSDT
jgi:hypothetical protein